MLSQLQTFPRMTERALPAAHYGLERICRMCVCDPVI